ncbi:hypothetical protein GCM10028808_75050 [Spirosoma migulaei]
MSRALVTSGGGAKGAFTVGALSYLEEKQLTDFDLISGTSTGALIAVFTAAKKISLLRNIYASVNNDDILDQQNIVDNFLFKKPYLFDTEPLQELARKSLDDDTFNFIKTSKTILCLTAISLQTGRITVFSTKPIEPTEFYDVQSIETRDDLLNAMIASSNQAGFLPPVSIKNKLTNQIEQFVDGGNREVIPTRVVVFQKPTEIFVLSNNPRTFAPLIKTFDKIIDTILRAITIFIQEVRENDLAVLKEYTDEKGIKPIFIEPDHDLDPLNPTGLNFDRIVMANWQVEGFKKAEQACTQAKIVNAIKPSV